MLVAQSTHGARGIFALSVNCSVNCLGLTLDEPKARPQRGNWLDYAAGNFYSESAISLEEANKHKEDIDIIVYVYR